MTTGNSELHESVIDQVLDLNGSPEVILQSTIDLLHSTMPGWNWVGIYFLRGDQLILGPYKGPATEHKEIKVGEGVCGSAVKDNENKIIDDVTTIENYIACSPDTKSEIVVLIKYQDQVVAQFDVDSDKAANFTVQDEEFLTEIAELVGPYCRVLATKP